MQRIGSQVQHFPALLIKEGEIRSEDGWTDKVFAIQVLHNVISERVIIKCICIKAGLLKKTDWQHIKH
jgi:hypothetical protein